MKKTIALLTALCLLISVAAAAAAETAAPAEPVAIHNGTTFGMTPEEVIAAEGNARFERDMERTFAVTFSELEYENLDFDGVRCDITYRFVDNALVAAQMHFGDFRMNAQQLVATLTAAFGEPAPLDPAELGNAVYAVDDEGRPEFGAVAFTHGDMMIVVEQDEDDIDVTYLNLAAAYVR